MKLEKISDAQIRCTLDRDDLIDREIRLSELAYGTDKARTLFRDMMQQASYEFGFEAEDIPLMIEAIPVSTECLILIITKIEDPEELDTRFSKFSADDSYDESDIYEYESDLTGADEILDLFKKITNEIGSIAVEQEDEYYNVIDSHDDNEFIPLPQTIAKNNPKAGSDNNTKKSASINTNLVKTYSFNSLKAVTQLCSILKVNYNGVNTLYKNPVTSTYYLVINKSEHTPEEFNKVCNIVSEYAKKERTTYASISYFQEHFEIIVKDKAVQVLSAF